MVKMTGFGIWLLFLDFYGRSVWGRSDGSFLFHFREFLFSSCRAFCFSAKPEGRYRVEADEDFINQNGTDHTHHKPHNDAQREVTGHIFHLLRPERLDWDME